MKKTAFAAALLLCCTVIAFPQTKPRLGVLSFYGGAEGEGETIATLFSHQPELLDAFTVVSRTGAALNAIFTEHDFQLSGYTDSDTIAGIGKLLNAEYVLSGSISRLGNRNLLIATIIHVQSYEQVAGIYQSYLNLREIQNLLPSISTSLKDAVLNRERSKQNSLALVPFDHLAGINPHDTETLTQILAIEILETGSYTILPRTKAIQAAQEEQKFQAMGWTEDEGFAAVGHAVNADYVLSGKISRLEGVSIFMAQILSVESGSVVHGTSRSYGVITDGIYLMEEIAILLTDPVNAEQRITELNMKPERAERRQFLEDLERRQAGAARQHEAEKKRQEREAKRERQRQERSSKPFIGWLISRRDNSIRSEIEWLSFFIGWKTEDNFFDDYSDSAAGAGSSFIPFLLPCGIYWSPAPFFCLGLETRRVRFSEALENEERSTSPDGRFRTAAFTIGPVLSPFDMGRFFANLILEMGDLDNRGIIGNNVSPGFDFGFIFDPPGVLESLVNFNIKYRCVFLDGHSTQAISFGASFTFEAVKQLFNRTK